LLTIGTGAVTNAGYLLTIGGTGNTTVSSAIDGSGGLTKNGAGTLTLSGTNTYTGATTISEGTLRLSGSGSINSSSGIVIQGGTLTSTTTTTGTTPFGANNIDFKHGTLSLVPASAGAYAFTGANAAAGSTFTYSGGANLVLTRNGANTLSYTIGNAGATANSVLARSGNGTLVVQPTAFANMGGSVAGSENFIINQQTTASNKNGASSAAGIFDASVVGQASNVGTFLSYGTGAGGLSAGFAQATYTVPTNASTIAANSISDVTSSIAINDLSNPYALRVGAFTLTNSGTTTVNGGAASGTNSGLGGVILNSTATASTITGGTLAFGSSEGMIFAASSGAGNGTIASKISGSAGITKFGIGTLVLSSTTSDFTGGVRINQGTLSISADTNLGNTGNGITFNGAGTLTMTTAVTTSRAITLNNGAIASIYSPAGSTSIISGAVTGNGGVTWGNTSMNVNHNIQFNSTGNTFTGPLTVGVASANTTSAMTMNSIADSASQLIMNGGGQGVSWTYGSGAIAPLTFNNRQIVLKTSDQSTIANASSYSLTINTDLGFSGTGARNLRLGGAGGGTFNGTLTDNAGGVLTPTFGGGTWYVSGTNSYSGDTIVAGSTAVFQGKQSMPSASALNASSSGANFKILDDGAGTINYGNTVKVPLNYSVGASATFFVGNNNTANGGTSAGATTGSTMVFGTLDMTIGDSRSRQTVNFQGANGYQIQFGNMIIPRAYGREDAGSVMLAPSTAAVTITGTVQQANGRFDNLNPVNGLGLAGSGVGTISGTIKDAADYTDLSNANAKPLALTKSSTSVWTLSGTNTYTGTTTLSGGTLSINSIGNVNGGSSALGNPSSAANGTIAIGSTTTAATLVYTGSAATTDRVINLAGTTGGATLDQSGSGLLKFTSALTATGGGSKTLTLQGSTNGTGEIAAAIVDNSGTHKTSVVKGGTGAWTLSGTNTYTGSTTVSGGTLAVNGSLASASSVTVQNGGTLQGSGIIGGSVTIQNGGTLATGNSIESLATGALSLQALATFAQEINNDAAATVAGDLTAVTGNLTLDLGNAAILTLTELGSGSWSANEKLTLISYSGTWNGGLFNYGGTLADDSTINFSGATWQFNYNDTVAGSNYTSDLTGTSFVTMTVIPEPRAALLGGLGLLMLLRRRR